MSKFEKCMIFLDALILPIIPLLFLYNQNSQHLDFYQIIVVSIVLIVIVAIFYASYLFLSKSEGFAFLGSLFLVIFLFAHNNIYNNLVGYGFSSIVLLLIIPFISYLFSYICFKACKNIKFNKMTISISVFIFMMLVMNIQPLLKLEEASEKNELDINYKLDFEVDDKLESPNIYWFFCDGMLGFDSMERYFGDSQEELISSLNNRGFEINKKAMLETGHLTRVAIPTLMCPDYYDKYLFDILSSHESAMHFRKSSDFNLYSARVNNEMINAFEKKGYTTITISIDDRYFLPITDYFYYVNAYYKKNRDYYTRPSLVIKSLDYDEEFYRSRFYAHQIGDIFLGGIPSYIYDEFFSTQKILKIPLETSFENISEILLNSNNSNMNSEIVNSLYDAINIRNIDEPRIMIIHNLMAHNPFNKDEDGNLLEKDKIDNIAYYKGHHKYASKVLVNMIDMILLSDPNAIIVLQADHGLHMQSKDQIQMLIGDDKPTTDIWNSVFSAIRVPVKYKNDNQVYALEDPRNISRYLINSFVGSNYSYLIDLNKKNKEE